MAYFTPGEELKLQEYISLSNETLDISDLVIHSTATLETMREDSIKTEEVIFQKLKAVVAEWTAQAKETKRLKKAMEYLRVLPVKHTSNVWTVNQHGTHEISNMVYKMTWRVNERTKWDSKKDMSVTVAWVLTWDVHFNTVHNPDYHGSGWSLAGQRDKVFAEKAAMEKYLQGRINTYAHLFTELSPPIPQDQARRFFVNGQLLPGYTIENPEMLAPDTETVDALLACLEDDDPAEPEAVEPPTIQNGQTEPQERPVPPPKNKPALKRTAHKKKQTAPTR